MTTLSTAEAADALGVSAVRVRQMLHGGELAGALEQRRGREVWRVDPDSVAVVLQARQAQGRSMLTLASINERLAGLEAGTRPAASFDPGVDRSAVAGPGVIDALTLRAVAAEQAAADAARSKVIEHLLAALTASEEADTHRRAAIAAAETALGMKLVPDDASQVTATGPDRDSDGAGQA